MISNPSLVKEYYEALVEKDSSYTNSFIAAVKTTGIFCISTCYARKPNFENVEFYKQILEAEAAGYRACKRCKPKG